MEQVECRQCGGNMEKAKKVNRSMTLQLLGVALFIISLPLLFMFPVGTFVGLILMVVSARMGYSKTNVWKCGQCGYYFERI